MDRTRIFAVNAWLSHCMDRYRRQVQAANIELYFSESSFNRATPEHKSRALIEYVDAAIQLALLAQNHGDEERQLWTLRRTHGRLLSIVSDNDCPRPLRVLSLEQSKKTLAGLCNLYQQKEQGKQLVDTLKIEYQYARENLN